VYSERVMDRDLLVAAPERRLDRVRARLTWPVIWRVVRYGLTSVIALGISEVTLLVIVATHLTGATVAAAIASLVGVLPSYLISRYWIWPEADRTRTGQQVAVYWAISIVSIALTSFGTGFIAHHTPEKGAAHVAVVGIGFPILNLILWVAKYFLYHLVVFKRSEPGARDWALAAESIDVDVEVAAVPYVTSSLASQPLVVSPSLVAEELPNA